jgi:predicted nucleotidyltransferase
MQDQTKVILDFPFPEERVFRYQAMQDILHHLVNNPLTGFTQTELATITGADVSSISRSVNLLEQLGVVAVTGERPTKIRIDQEHLERADPLFSIPQQEFRKPVQTYLSELKTQVSNSEKVDELIGVVLFGSVARGTADRQSDIDLVVIVTGDLTHGRRLCTQVARDIEEEPFDGERYQFEVLVETPDSAGSRGNEVAEIFGDGLVLVQTEQLVNVQQRVCAEHRGDDA